MQARADLLQQFQKPVLRQEQRLKLTPQLVQAIQIMALPIQDLRLKIEEELEKNPALEVIEDPSEVSIDQLSAGTDTDYSVFEESSDPGYSRRDGQEASDQKQQFIEGTLTRPESLRDHLVWQLRLQPLPQRSFEVGELLIRNLDENGFHIEPPETLVGEKDLPLMREMMRLVQRLDPPGCCTSGYQESLLVQIADHPQPHPLARPLVEKYLELLERGRNAEIARKLRTTEAEIAKAVAFLQTLDPMPGRNYAGEAQYVIPDVMVQLREGEFVIVLNDEEIPVLSINSGFARIADGKGGAKDLSRFVKGKLNDARWFIRSIHQRNQTLLKTVKTIVEFQREFFRRGPKYLVPLTLKDIASEIGVHEATVSRITTAKYVQTEWGIFELKYFFTNSISGSGSSGSRFSKEGVKEVIREIITEEGHRQLSDREIADILHEKGIDLARRTVSKYRKELDIGSSFHR
jgi:RNA polymerase sigma-54 factor